MTRRPGQFFAGPDIAGSPAIRMVDPPISNGILLDRYYSCRITWIGAYWGAFWRNVLGRFYVPFDPTNRWLLRRAREAR